MASGSDVNGSTESFEMVIEEATIDSATKQNSGMVLKIICNFRQFLRFHSFVNPFGCHLSALTIHNGPFNKYFLGNIFIYLE